MARSVNTVTLKFWHGGAFKKDKDGCLGYFNGLGKTYIVDLDELCWWFLKDMACKCGNYLSIESIYYLKPGKSLDDGLVKVYHDHEVLEMGEIVKESRCIELYVVHNVSGPPRSPDVILVGFGDKVGVEAKGTPPKRRKKLSLRRKITLSTAKSPPPKANGKSTPPKVVSPPLIRSSPRFSKQPHAHNSTPKETQLAPNQNQTETSHIQPPLPEIHIPLNEDENDGYQPEPEDYDLDFNEDENDGYQPETEDYDLDFNEDENDKESTFDDEFHFEDELYEEFVHEYPEDIPEADSTDDELREARLCVKKSNLDLKEIADRLRKQVNEGYFGGTTENASTSAGLDQNSEVLSEYENSDEEQDTPVESDDEYDGKRRKARALVVSDNTDWSKFVWRVGQRFKNREAFRNAVAQYAIAQGKNLRFSSSNITKLQRMEAQCVVGCPFKVYGSWDKRRCCFFVKSLKGEHSCTRDVSKNRQLKAKWIARHFLELFKARPHWPAEEIKETVQRVFRCIITKSLAYRVKYNAHQLLHGSMKEHYNNLASYLHAVKNANPETDINICTVQSNTRSCEVFQRLYFCFDGLRRGWLEGCRRVLCVDACFLKTFLGGQLMAAIGRDANEQMYLVAWAVVEGENTESWDWFFENLKKSLELGDGNGLSLLSDEHQAIIGAIAKILPHAEHRHCARHIFANWHKSFRGEDFKLKFWIAAKAYNEADFTDAMSDLAELSSPAEEQFRGYDPSLFCRSKLSTEPKVDVIVNNLAETFNGYTINSRTKHLIYMLEEIRTKLMQRLVLKKIQMEKRNKMLCPRVQAKLELEKEKAALCHLMPSTATKFQVNHQMDTLMVNLEARSCTCRKWDLTRIPCCHAVACVFFFNRKAEDFVDNCYKVDTYMKSYNVSIPPIIGEKYWPKVDAPLDPPPVKIGPGRPRKKRIRDPYENPKKPGKLTKHGIVMTCSRCGSTKHNIRKCKEEAVPEANHPKQKKQKKKKTVVAALQIASTSSAHFEATAQPQRTGRGGRVIRGSGTRGGRGRGRNEGRGRGRGRLPRGVGVLVGGDGSTYYNRLGQSGGPVEVTQIGHPIESQSSTAAQL